jgi:hypothetical protein
MDLKKRKRVVFNKIPAAIGWNLQSYWTIARLRKLTVVLNYCGTMETYSRIGISLDYESRFGHEELAIIMTHGRFWRD